MDIDDVSGMQQYAGYLDGFKATLQQAKLREGEIPKDKKSRSEQIQGQEMNARQLQFQMNHPSHQGHVTVHSSFVPPPYLPCVTSLDNLKPIFIKELRLGINHRGRYLVVRSAATATRMTAILTVVEDEVGDCTLLQLYQQPPEHIAPTSSRVAVGDVFIVKEPFFKVNSDGGYGVRVDHINDCLRIDTRHKLFPDEWQPRIVDLDVTADDWKQEGNAAFGAGKYLEAIEKYTHGLASNPSPAEEVVIRLNRALANLKYGRFDDALADTQYTSPSHTLPDTEKALHRCGKALYELGRFSESVDIFQKLVEEFSNNSEGVKELARAHLRLSEEQTGQFDFKAMYKELSKLRPPILDHATFIGPIIVKATKDRGEGVFTTSAVKAGDLLLCEKAFAHAYAPDTDEEVTRAMAKMSLLINTHNNKMTLGTQTDLITSIVQKLANNPSLLPKFVALHHGSEYKPSEILEVDEKLVVDTFLIERVVTLNVFGCVLSSKDRKPDTDAKGNTKHHSCGLWPLASKINHSCKSNIRRSFIGDLMIICATCDIPATTELAFWYKNPTGDHQDMKTGLSQWEFECKCPVCLDTINTSKKQIKKRSDLLGDLKVVLAASDKNLEADKAERLLTAIGQTYKLPASEVPRYTLHEPYMRLLSVYNQRQRAEKVHQAAVKTLEVLGFVVSTGKALDVFQIEKWGVVAAGVDAVFTMLWHVYAAMKPDMLKVVEQYEKMVYKICVGEDASYGDYCKKNHLS